MEIVLRSPIGGRYLERTRSFLQQQGLDWDEHIQSTVLLEEEGEILATGSRHDNVLKCIAVLRAREGEGLIATVVTELVKDALSQGYHHLFLFTKPGNIEIFFSLGFHLISKTGEVAMLENRKNGIRRFVESLTTGTGDAPVGAIIMNCNPFTNGHRYLVETASGQCGALHLFILSEDKSAFSAETRIELVRQGTADLSNVIVHPTGDYLISSATFPDYFIKDKARAGEINCALDLTVFAEHFAKPLGITRRFVGTEPTDPVTADYNRQMTALLPAFGIEVIEIPRKEAGGRAISASVVRRLMEEGNLEEIRGLVPDATYRYIENSRKN